MRGLRDSSSQDDLSSSPSPSTSPPADDLEPGSSSLSSRSAHFLTAHLFEDSEWSPPVDKEFSEDMPCLPDRYSFCWPKKPKPVDPEQHTVWLFDNTAFRLESPSNLVGSKFPHSKASHAFVDPALNNTQPRLPPKWQVEFVSVYFADKLHHDPNAVARAVCRRLGITDDELALDKVKKRIEPFVTPVLPRSTVRVNIDNFETQTLGPGSRYGIASSVNRLHFDPRYVQQVTTNAEVSSSRPDFLLPCNTIFAEPCGWGIISDIDDTIKLTMTSSPLGILRTTFVDDPQPVPGMPELYIRIQQLLSEPCWFYLSASPYTLYPFLRTFRQQYYPNGTIILRDASWQNLGGLISSLMVNVQEYKVNRMMKLHGWFPKRAFVCIGDSTQKDPESYGEIARMFPGWIKAIFIRKVTNVSGLSDPDEERKNRPERFKRAFEGVGDDVVCYAFDKPEEVVDKINAMLATSTSTTCDAPDKETGVEEQL